MRLWSIHIDFLTVLQMVFINIFGESGLVVLKVDLHSIFNQTLFAAEQERHDNHRGFVVVDSFFLCGALVLCSCLVVQLDTFSAPVDTHAFATSGYNSAV